MRRKEVTIEEVAEKAGVSTATVSRIINNKGNVKKKTRDHVIEVMQEMNFHLEEQRSLADTRSHNILVCVPDLRNPFYSGIIDGISQSTTSNGYNMLILQSRDYIPQMSDFSNVLRETSIAGILILSPVDAAAEKILKQLTYTCPIVMCSEYSETADFSYVSINDVDSAQNAVEYLISTGCRKIGLINSTRKFKYARHREKGYKMALNRHALDYGDSWIAHVSSISYRIAYATALHMLQQKDHPDAIFCCSDVYGIAAVNAAKSLHLKVPEDVSVIGFDNVDNSQMCDPPLTTVSQPALQMGLQACDLLLEKIQTPHQIEKQIILNTELIVRGTTRLPSY